MTTHTDTDPLVHTIIERAKKEIMADIETGRVPSTVTTFSELHDYVDANEYGGLTDIPVELNLADRVQNALDGWLRTRPTTPDFTRQTAHFDDQDTRFEVLTAADGRMFVTDETYSDLAHEYDDLYPLDIDPATGLRDMQWEVNFD